MYIGQGRRNRYGHYGHGRTTFSANSMAYYCIKAENYRRACQLGYDVDSAPENDRHSSGADRDCIIIICVEKGVASRVIRVSV